MYRSKFLSFILIITISLLFSGCSNVFEWGKITFNQGCKLDASIVDIPRQCIRTGRVYDQFTTLGIFDAMLLTPGVIKAYVDLHKDKFSLSDEEAKELFDCECKEKTENYISFYVLAFEPDRFESPLYIPCKYEDSPWVLTMEINGNTYLPMNIKKIELEIEYKLFFGKIISQFKKVYLVQFTNKDNYGNCLINPGNKIVLCFKYLINQVSLTW